MKAVRVHEYGGPEVLKADADVAIPAPKDNEVLIKVLAAGVNPVDTYIRTGTHSRRPPLPYIPGMDAAGLVEKVGSQVKNVKAGDRVFTVGADSGAYAQYATATADLVFPLHSNLDFDQGASLGVPYFTAYRALFTRGHCKPGETVLVHGASGAVGIAAVQIARAHGLTVFGTAGTEEGLKLVQQVGAHHVFNHREQGYMDKIRVASPNGEGVDIILEMLANVNLDNDLQIMRWKTGRVMVIGSRGPVQINPRYTMAKESDIRGVTLFSSSKEDWSEMGAAINAGMELGYIKPIVGATYPLHEAARSHHDVINNEGTRGKLILHTWE